MEALIGCDKISLCAGESRSWSWQNLPLRKFCATCNIIFPRLRRGVALLKFYRRVTDRSLYVLNEVSMLFELIALGAANLTIFPPTRQPLPKATYPYPIKSKHATLEASAQFLSEQAWEAFHQLKTEAESEQGGTH